MKYTAQQINQLSWQEWNALMAKELNAAGFKTKEFTGQRWEKTGKYDASVDPELFSVQLDAEAIEYCKQLGLINNGRCMMCGGRIVGNPGRFTDGFNHNIHYQMCQNCVSRGKRMSVNPANNNSGCMVALLLLPLHIIKSFLIN